MVRFIILIWSYPVFYDAPNGKSESVIVSKAFLEENAEMMSDIALGRVGCGIYTADVVMRDSYMVKEPHFRACPQYWR